MLRSAPVVLGILMAGPVVLGLLMVILPAFGYLPAVGREEFSTLPWRDLFSAPGIHRSALLSLVSGLVTPIIALTIVMLFLAGISGSKFDRLIRRLVSPLLAIPHAAAAFGLAFLIAPSGFLARLASPSLSGWQRPPDLFIINDPLGLTMMAGLVTKEIPFLLLMALAALPQLDPGRRVMMARSLGYRPVLAWLFTVAPALYPMIRLPLFAVIAFASSVVDVAIILGPGLPATLSVRILGWFSDPDLSLRLMASAGAILQVIISLTAIACWLLLEKVVGHLWRYWTARGQRRRFNGLLLISGRIGMTVTVMLLSASVSVLAINAFAGPWRFPASLPASWTWQHWANTASNLVTPVANTLLISLSATAIALVLVLATLENEQRHGKSRFTALSLLYMPLLVPQVAFIFGLVVFTETMAWQPGTWLVVVGHCVFVIPYVFLTLSEAFRRLDPRWVHMARSLGASPNRIFWRIRLPILLGTALTASAIGVAVSVGQFLPTQLLGAGRVPTVTTEAVALASGGSRNVIAVWALLQSLIPAAGFILALTIPRLLWRKRRAMQESA